MRASSKDLLEHRWVTDYVEAVLQQYCAEYRIKDKGALLKLQHVQHMICRYEGSLKPQFSAIELLAALHPTPAVAGVPKASALAHLRCYEGMERGWFGGSIGWLNGDSGDFAIGIRSALLDQSILRVFAGAGIVEASNPESEWHETQAKMRKFYQGFSQPPPGSYPRRRCEELEKMTIDSSVTMRMPSKAQAWFLALRPQTLPTGFSRLFFSVRLWHFFIQVALLPQWGRRVFYFSAAAY